MKGIWRWVELLHEALIYMILKGDKALLQEYVFSNKELVTHTFPTFFWYSMTDITEL